MRKVNYLAVTLGVMCVLFYAPAEAQNSLDVNNGAAINGAFGLEVLVDGSDASPAYVATNTPDAEPGVRIEFKVQPNTSTPLDIAPAPDNMRIMKGLTTFPRPPNASSVEHLIVFFKRNFLDTNYRIRVMTQQNFGFFATCAEFFVVVDGGPAKTIAIEWVQGTGPQGSQDGRCSVFMDGVLQNEQTNLNTSEFNINEVRFGVFQITDATATGSYYLDDVVITRVN